VVSDSTNPIPAYKVSHTRGHPFVRNLRNAESGGPGCQGQGGAGARIAGRCVHGDPVGQEVAAVVPVGRKGMREWGTVRNVI